LIAQRGALEVVANVEPGDVEPLLAKICSAELGGRELARAEHARMDARADLAEQLGARHDLGERRETLVEQLGI
jgi:hypothetical protein